MTQTNFVKTYPQFYDIFSFEGMMHDAFDGGILYQNVTILEDLVIPGYRKIVKGEEFECVEFMFHDSDSNGPTITFANYQSCEMANSNGTISHDLDTTVTLPLSVLAPYCVWK